MDTYQVYAIRYARHERAARENFLEMRPGEDPHQTMPLDYYIWAIVGSKRTIVVDTGFGPTQAKLRGRDLLRSPAEGLRAIGIAPDGLTAIDPQILDTLPDWAQRWKSTFDTQHNSKGTR